MTPIARSARLTSPASPGARDRRRPMTSAPSTSAPPRPLQAAVRPNAVRIWVMAARVRTLPAAIAPVLVGTSLALGDGTFEALAFLAALLGAMFIQVGTNLSNDYSDARRGADSEDRLGPVRVTAGGLVPPRQVLVATYASFGLAVACGAYLVAVAGPELLAVGAASILAGRALYGRAAAVWLRGPRRAVRVPVLRRGRRRGVLFRAGAGAALAGLRLRGARRACSRARFSSSTTCATSTPTGARASARSR